MSLKVAGRGGGPTAAPRRRSCRAFLLQHLPLVVVSDKLQHLALVVADQLNHSPLLILAQNPALILSQPTIPLLARLRPGSPAGVAIRRVALLAQLSRLRLALRRRGRLLRRRRR